MDTDDDIRRRAEERRKRMVVNFARTHEEAEDWDLDFWQKQGPQGRLSALVAIHRDLAEIRRSRRRRRAK